MVGCMTMTVNRSQFAHVRAWLCALLFAVVMCNQAYGGEYGVRIVIGAVAANTAAITFCVPESLMASSELAPPTVIYVKGTKTIFQADVAFKERDDSFRKYYMFIDRRMLADDRNVYFSMPIHTLHESNQRTILRYDFAEILRSIKATSNSELIGCNTAVIIEPTHISHEQFPVTM